MLLIACKIYGSTSSGERRISAATELYTGVLAVCDVTDLSVLNTVLPNNTNMEITDSSMVPNSNFNALLGCVEINESMPFIQYSSSGDMVGINAVKSLFNTQTISDSTEYPVIFVQFMKDTSKYFVQGTSGGNYGLYDTETETLIDATGTGSYFAGIQYNQTNNNISFPVLILDGDSSISYLTFSIDRSSATRHTLKVSRPRDIYAHPFSNTAIQFIISSAGPLDPYGNGGNSEENLGGNGTFDGSSDQIDDSTLPTISAANTGFTRIYNPSLAQVQALANYLWTDQTIIQTLWNHVKQFLENPMDAFIAFNLVPCAVPDGGTAEFKVMYIGTGVNMTAAASQFVDVDCGTLDIDEYYGSALDYAPNTKISVFLPFIGTVQLDTDDVMGKTIGIKYRIDIVSGGCVAKITVDGSIHYQYSGHCAINIPFTSADYTGYISAMLQAAKVGSTIASAGASAAAATAEEGIAIPEMAAAGATAAEMMEASRAYDRRIVGSAVEGSAQAAFNSLAPKNISNTVGVVMSSKPVVERSGSFSGNTGYLGIRRPFCIIERPRMCNPSDYGKYNGRPAMLTMSLGDCSGFTKVQQVQLTGIPATNPELDEIGAFLKGGVIL